MIIRIVSLGCNWWGRPGVDPDDPYQFTRSAAYFNSTGVRCGNKIRRHWVVDGLIRFNGVSDFDPQRPLNCIGRTYLCSDLTIWASGNRILFHNSATGKSPDTCLVTLTSDEHGIIDYTIPGWKSTNVKPIAVSQLRQQQEAMFLMNPGDWIRTNCGVWCLTNSTRADQSPVLQLLIC
jgi:hypothetical protein